MKQKRKIIVLTGATASGKTSLAIKLAHKINAQIICADSRIIYKGFDIVSAKPTVYEREGVIHHLIDIIEPDKDFSAGDFVERAKKIIDNTNSNIIVTGGTWFYIKSLFDGFSLIESSKNPELRNSLEKLSNAQLHEKLRKLDFKRAKEVHQNNRDKVIRSIEMCEFLGSPVSEYKRKQNTNYNPHWFKTEFEREILYDRINKRVDKMMELGLYEEWKKNSKLYPNSLIIQNTIGYSEFFEYEDINLAIEKIKQHTRNFAKRQLSYFRSRQDIKKVDCIDDILAYISDSTEV